MQMLVDKVILMVLDSVGIGELPDAANYGDCGCNTLKHIAEACGGIHVPNMCALGLGKIAGVDYLKVPGNIIGCYGRMTEASAGKDTITGHWEIAGVVLNKGFPTYPDGFPAEIIDSFEKKTGRKVLGNVAASGTEIIRQLGEMHIKTGRPIVYTSADSVFQIAAHEDIIDICELYHMCSIARDILVGENSVGRVVARPFKGDTGNFRRTSNRRDFALEPVSDTILDAMSDAGLKVWAVGKTEDIFSGRGITYSVHTKDNMHGVDETIKCIREKGRGLVFTNLVDFDMLYGHRNDPEGYKKALEDFDMRLPEIMSAMGENDLLIITADHGCDPVFRGTDHTREYVPLLIYGRNAEKDIDLGTRENFCDIACTISDMFSLNKSFPGRSFLNIISNEAGPSLL
ncbi:MAG TPA: phosphopentomutase [Clostridiaceae bacterium]|nr:phosphopentomutase [Clostridiaceae bacterium]